MGHTVPNMYETWLPHLHTAVETAMKHWTAQTLPAVLPGSLTAAAEDEAADATINLEALLSSVEQWSTIVDDEITPVVVALLTAQTVTVTGVRELDLTPLASGGVSDEVLQEAVATARRLLSAWGIAKDEVEIVVTRRTWLDFMEEYVASSLNQVKNMPESVYADLVAKLSDATVEGKSPFERNLIVREFLDMEKEGGFEEFTRRASAIARTETNRLVNASTMQSARMEQTVTGEVLEKVWVATTDTRTRDSHFAADGQRVPVDGQFQLGFSRCDYPGDPQLPPEESINCRCTTLLLAVGDPLPSEADRQTERERSDGTRRSPAQEVKNRAERGVTRWRDDETEATITAGMENNMRTKWQGILAPIGKPSGDGRIIDGDAAVGFRDFPLPLMYQRAQSSSHDQAVIVGKITSATVEADGIHAVGELFDTEEAIEAIAMLTEEVIRPSVDMCDMEVDWVLVDGDGNALDTDDDPSMWDEVVKEEMHVRAATIMGATLVSKPAFREAKITLGDAVSEPDGDASVQELAELTASVAVQERVDADLFVNPQLSAPTPVTVTEDGHVFGHLALWGTEHVGVGRGVTPPKSKTGYALFHVSALPTTEGDLAVGRLTVGTGHASARQGVHAASEHYDQTGSTWAFVRAGEDEHGIWVAGIVNPDASEKDVRAGASAPLSGDWRRVAGNLELVAALSVNTPGFPVPRSFAAESQEMVSLVAAAVVVPKSKHEELVTAVVEGVARHEALKVESERQFAARQIAASFLARNVIGNA